MTETRLTFRLDRRVIDDAMAGALKGKVLTGADGQPIGRIGDVTVKDGHLEAEVVLYGDLDPVLERPALDGMFSVTDE